MGLAPLPKYSRCDICPVSSAPFTERFTGRLMLLEIGLGGFPKNKLLLWSYLALVTSTVLSFELLYFIIQKPFRIMKKAISFLTALALIAVPSYLLIKHPSYYNVTAQILFNILLFGAALWFANEQNTEKARKEASSKWLPAAEGACKQLITIAHIVSRMRTNQKASCSKIDPLIPEAISSECKSLKHFFELQCKETGEDFSTIKNQLDNAISHWEMFIAENCESDSCFEISQRIEGHKRKLEQDSMPAQTGTLCEQQKS